MGPLMFQLITVLSWPCMLHCVCIIALLCGVQEHSGVLKSTTCVHVASRVAYCTVILHELSWQCNLTD